MSELVNYDKVLATARSLLDPNITRWKGQVGRSQSVFNLQGSLEECVMALDTLLAERAVYSALRERQAVQPEPNQIAFNHIADKLDEIINHLNYGSVRAR